MLYKKGNIYGGICGYVGTTLFNQTYFSSKYTIGGGAELGYYIKPKFCLSLKGGWIGTYHQSFKYAFTTPSKRDTYDNLINLNAKSFMAHSVLVGGKIAYNINSNLCVSLSYQALLPLKDLKIESNDKSFKSEKGIPDTLYAHGLEYIFQTELTLISHQVLLGVQWVIPAFNKGI